MNSRTYLLSCCAMLAFTGCGDNLTVECGDGIVDTGQGEQCDDSNTANGDGCSALCLLETPDYCGDGTVDTGEVCDDGNTTDGDGCASNCRSDETCGNSVVDTALGEVCDDGNNIDGDGCEADCELQACPTGLTDCSGTCVDTDVDSGNCGGCDDGAGSNTCAAGEVCNGSGACAVTCQTGLTDCSGNCTDTDVDSGNCGGCDDGAGSNTCAPGEVCNGSGSCDLTCQVGLTDCSGTCTDTDFDPNNCGGCDDGGGSNTCGGGEYCNGSGVCAPIGGGCDGTGVCIIPITAAMMTGTVYASCGNNPPEYSAAPCGSGVNGFQWTDTVGVAPVGIEIDVFPFWNCNAAGTRDVMFNGTDVGDYTTGGGCVCAAGLHYRDVTFTSVAPFTVSGLNTVAFPTIGANCEAWGPSSSSSTNYGYIILTY